MWTSLIPLPYRWAIVAAMFAASFATGWIKGAGHVRDEWSTADALHARQDADHQLKDLAAARGREQALREYIEEQLAQRAKENADHAKELDTLRAAARAGTERLRCPAAALPSDTQAADSGAATRPEPEAGRDSIVPGAADDLFRIAASIRQGVRERNALIDAYNEAQATCNAP